MIKSGFLATLILAFPFSIHPLGCEQFAGITIEDGLLALQMTTGELLETIGDDYIEIDPAIYESRADRIVYHPCGLTFWFLNGRTAQIRVDSAWGGSIKGISMGVTLDVVIKKCGPPWIEADESLYYNLPWLGSAVRIRFFFEEGMLKEVYLFKVL